MYGYWQGGLFPLEPQALGTDACCTFGLSGTAASHVLLFCRSGMLSLSAIVVDLCYMRRMLLTACCQVGGKGPQLQLVSALLRTESISMLPSGQKAGLLL